MKDKECIQSLIYIFLLLRYPQHQMTLIKFHKFQDLVLKKRENKSVNSNKSQNIYRAPIYQSHINKKKLKKRKNKIVLFLIKFKMKFILLIKLYKSSYLNGNK